MKMLFGLAIIMSMVVHATSQPPIIHGQRVDLLPGNIVGANLDEEHGVFYIEQLVLSTEDQKINTHHLVTSWSLSSNKMLAKREFAVDPGQNNPLPRCGDIALATKSHRLFVCGQAGIEILDTKDLRTTGKIAEGQDLKTYQIAVDEQRNILVVLSGRTNKGFPSSPAGSLWLSSYSLSDGSLRGEIQLGSLGIVDTSELILDLSQGRIAVALTRRGGNQWSSSVYLCREDALSQCTNLAQVDAISQMSFFENELLFVTQMPAQTKGCVMSLDIETRAVTEAYCAHASGVRYAFGVVGGKYIVGFSGRNKRAHLLGEEYVNVSNALSIWVAGKSQVAGTTFLLQDHGIQQENVRIVGSVLSPLFLAYAPISGTSNAVLGVYSISVAK